MTCIHYVYTYSCAVMYMNTNANDYSPDVIIKANAIEIEMNARETANEAHRAQIAFRSFVLFLETHEAINNNTDDDLP